MPLLMISVRALHYASVVSLSGALIFAVLIAGPALRRRGDAGTGILRGRLHWLIWSSFLLGLLSGSAWLILEASSMSGKPLDLVFAQGIIGVVLTRTHFGHDWALRGLIAVPLAISLVAGLRHASGLARVSLWVAVVLAAAELALVAGAGHAAAGSGETADLQLIGDGAHLLAAGAWLGSLVPLVLLWRSSGSDARGLAVSRDATRRFSLLGVTCVGTLIITGIINSWFLVGGFPGLFGTPYGQLLLLKLALFLAMVTIAAVNRQRLTPRLAVQPAATAALRSLQRNALGETMLGLAILGIVGALGTTPPGAHIQVEWPLPFRLDLNALPPDPALDRSAALYGAMVGLGLAALLWAAMRRRWRWFMAAAGLILVIGFGRVPLEWMVEPAYPTSFYHPTVPYTDASVVRGAAIYGERCALCHGAEGRGNGAAARSLPVPPADLTAAHLLSHTPGDLFWWVSEGRSGGAMPGFASLLSESERWDVINFIRGRASAAQPLALAPAVTAAPASPAPDFTFERGGSQESLHEASQAKPVLLAFYRLPQSLARLQALAAVEARLRAAGLDLLAVPLAAPANPDTSELPDFVASIEPETARAYALVAGAGEGPSEFLIDRAGFLRARWRADSAKGLASPDELLAQLERLAQLPLARQAAHVHAH